MSVLCEHYTLNMKYDHKHPSAGPLLTMSSSNVFQEAGSDIPKSPV